MDTKLTKNEITKIKSVFTKIRKEIVKEHGDFSLDSWCGICSYISFNVLRNLGYNLVVMWESDWININKSIKTLQNKFRSK